ncbi:MAG: tagaturonate epimerase family protein [Fidelibacterota bacterium]
MNDFGKHEKGVVMKLSRYSMGVGDRFGREGVAQLAAMFKASEQGIPITPVWNKSFREHQIIGSTPADTRRAADEAVRSAGWQAAYFVDGDHIDLKTVDDFMQSSDFFTMDVADEIGKPVEDAKLREYMQFCERFHRSFEIPGIAEKLDVSPEMVRQIAQQYLAGILEAEKIYRHIAERVKKPFVLELSIDETEQPQRPVELFFILAGAAWCRLPLDTIAPKFSGRFNKGVDYVGDAARFAREFEEDILVVKFAVQEFGLPASLKLSVHSGSDKFTLYPIIRKILHKQNAGVHLKTAGTTWLEELIGIAAAGGAGLDLAKSIYSDAYDRQAELVKPYAPVLDIHPKRLPSPADVRTWSSAEFVGALRHVQTEKRYNPDFRQLLHVAYKIAAERCTEFDRALQHYVDFIAPNVTENLFERHIKPLFLEE